MIASSLARFVVRRADFGYYRAMGKNEKTSKPIASLASKVLSGEKKPTVSDAKKLAASVLTQTPDKKKH